MWNIFRRKKLVDKFQAAELKHFSANDAKLTPDIASLEKFQHVLLFAADETMEQREKHPLIAAEVAGGWGAFTESEFTLVVKNLGRESLAIPLDVKFQSIPSARIRGQLFLIRPYVFKLLDNYKQNGVQFKRLRINVQIPSRVKSWNGMRDVQLPLKTVEAWTYLGVEEYWMPLLDSGYLFKPASRFNHKNNPMLGQYYFYLETQ